jgi:hypothetical protein
MSGNKVCFDEFERKYGYEAAERAAIYEYEAGMTREEAEEKVKHKLALERKKV